MHNLALDDSLNDLLNDLKNYLEDRTKYQIKQQKNFYFLFNDFLENNT